uniref:Gustatory receptor n=2 Tax=Culex quinquefasciatus TaxID=7176 RepID=A0A1S4K3J8_CULQU
MHTYPYWRNPNVLWKKSSILAAKPFTVVECGKPQKGASESDHFHTAIAPVLTLSQLFGVFPLQSVLNRAPESMTFRTVSVTCVVSAISIFGGYTMLLLSLVRLGRDLNAINVAEPIFFGICATSLVIFWQLAKQWQAIAVAWSRTERTFVRYKSNLKGKIRFVAAALLLMALAEHLLFVANNVSYMLKEIDYCNWTIPDPAKFFFAKTFTTTFHTFAYSLPIAIYNEYIIISMTFVWNFIDLFIMLISIGIAARFDQLRDRVFDRINSWTPTTEHFWEQIRIQYVALCELAASINRAISKLVFVSYANDTYYIVLQIMNANQEQPSVVNKVYFWYSFAYLLLRTFLMFWYSAQVEHTSHGMCRLIQLVPTAEYCDELQRLQMYTKCGASLNGMGVFSVSRRIVLTLTGTIITYELVLLSYREGSSDQHSTTVSSCEPWQLT